MSSAAHTTEVQKRNVGVNVGPPVAAIVGLLYRAGALAFVVHLVGRSMLTAGVDPAVSAQNDLWVPVNALGAVGATLVLIGLPAACASITERGGRFALIGFALIEAAWVFFGLFLSLYAALVMPWMADEAPGLIDGSSPVPVGITMAFAIGLLAWLAGAVLLSIPFVRGVARPRWVGFLLPASALWFLAGNIVIAPDGPASNLALNLLSNLGPALLLIALAAPGASEYRRRHRG